MNNEKYRVRPGLSVSSKELYRRYRNNTLEAATHPNEAYTLDIEVQKFSKMTKPEQLNQWSKNEEVLTNLKMKLQS